MTTWIFLCQEPPTIINIIHYRVQNSLSGDFRVPAGLEETWIQWKDILHLLETNTSYRNPRLVDPIPVYLRWPRWDNPRVIFEALDKVVGLV